MRSRLGVIAILATWLVALAYAAAGVPESRPQPTSDPAGDGAVVANDPSAASSVWFCPSGSAGTPTAASHVVHVANPDDRVAAISVTSWNADGAAGPPISLEVPAASTLALTSADLGTAVGGSVLIESRPGAVTVAHRLVSTGLSDEGPCASRASGEAYFPILDTRRGASARLTIFNPFPADTVVDVTVSSVDGVRVPSELSSLVVRGASFRTIELGDIVQRRDLFSMGVRARSGRFVAEVAQYGDGVESPSGLRLQLGIPRTTDRVAFADGFVTGGIGERYVVYNPHAESARVALQVLPYDASAAARPEPFLLDVPARRAVTVDLAAEPRVAPDVLHWVLIDVLSGEGVAAARQVNVAGTNSSGLSSGIASSVGTPRSSTRWIVTGLDPAATTPASLLVANPSPDSIAVIEIATFVSGTAAAPAGVARIEVPPGQGTAVDLAPIQATAPAGTVMGLTLTAEAPVIIERRIIATSSADLSIVAGFPRVDGLAELPAVAAVSAPGAGD